MPHHVTHNIVLQYPEEMFFEGWVQITERYRDNPWVAGLDLRNEIRMNEHGEMSQLSDQCTQPMSDF